MKAKMIVTTIAIVLSINGLTASTFKSTLTFWNASGEELVQPLMMEEAVETVPVEVRCEFQRLLNSRVETTFDISELIKPEEEEELPFYIERIVQS